MDVLWETVGFAAKALIIVIASLVVAAVVFGRRRRGQLGPSGRVEVEALHRRHQWLADTLRHAVIDPKAGKQLEKTRNQEQKQRKKQPASRRPRLFVLDFKGDLLASAVEHLREEVSAVLAVAEDQDEVVVRLESSGGTVHGYGLAASQLARVKDQGVRLVCAVDRIAASGGYMMACVSNEILAAPFAVLGSIGVAAPVPNVNRLLDRHGIDFQEMTAGEYKRTVSFAGPITEKGRAKFQEHLEETHQLFQDFVHEMRPSLELSIVATGEHWYGKRALELGLADRLTTSDAYLVGRMAEADVFSVRFVAPENLRGRVAHALGDVTERLLLRGSARLSEVRWI